MEPLAEIRFEQLVEWIEGRLPAEEAADVAQQVATADEATRTAVAWLQRFHRLGRQVTLARPPEAVRRYLVAHFEAMVQRRSPGLFQRLVATLAFDSDAQLLVAGARSAGAPEQERQLVYTTSLADIVLNVGTAGERLTIAGQVFPLEDDADEIYSVQLLHDGTERAITATDNLGEFAFQPVRPDVYDLIVSSAQAEVVILSIELHSQA